MINSQQSFVAEHYAPRAKNYVESLDHSTGSDLDQIEAELAGCGTAHVLDLGCGGGHVSYRAAPHVKQVVACDLTADMLAAVAEQALQRNFPNIAVQQAAAEQLPFSSASFDIVLCRFTVHHWQNMEAGLREARRVLKGNGRAIFIDVTAPADRMLDTHLQTFELLRDASHVRDYTIWEWVAALSRSGFTLGAITARKLRMQFPVWIARTHTSLRHSKAIRSLQLSAPEHVRNYFSIGEDGSFDLDTTTFLTTVA